MKNIVIEGSRGVGKSTVTQLLRAKILNCTLINFTGFNEGGEVGLAQTIKYYSTWFGLFNSMKGTNSVYIHDRFYLSEMVYSNIYKDYDFEPYYNKFNNLVAQCFEDFHLVILVLEDEKEFDKRLKSRKKTKLFGRVSEEARESMEQQAGYIYHGNHIPPNAGIKLHYISVDKKSPDDIVQEIIEKTLLLQT